MNSELNRRWLSGTLQSESEALTAFRYWFWAVQQARRVGGPLQRDAGSHQPHGRGQLLDAPEVARANREFLRGIYSAIKDCDESIKFAFLAGVSKFSKEGLFSGPNNLMDFTLDPAHSAMCGYTESDLSTGGVA